MLFISERPLSDVEQYQYLLIRSPSDSKLVGIMKCLCTCFFIAASLFCSAHIPEKSILPSIVYARFCSDSLNDNQKALNVYNELILLLAKADNDSLRLVAETERIDLLNRTGQWGKVLKSLKDGSDLAQKLKDYRRLNNFFCIKGFIYAQLGFKKEAVKMLDQAFEIAMLINDWSKKNIYLGNISAVRAYVAETTEEKVFYFIKAYRHFMQVGEGDPSYRKAQVSGNSCYASAFMERDQLDSAAYYLSIAISHIDPKNLQPDDYYTILNFSALHKVKKNYLEAEKWLLYALKNAQIEDNLYRQSAIFYRLYNIMLMQRNRPQAILYLQKYINLKVSLDKDLLQNIGLVESELNEERELLLAAASKKQVSVALIFIGVTFLLCLAVGRFYIKLRKTQCSEEECEAVEKNITVEQINELNNLIKLGDRSFMMKFHECFPLFAAKVNELACSPLSYSEIEICACTKLNFSTKDIALYRECTVRSVENRKYRIRKKLKLDSEIDLVVWIASIK